MTVRIHRDREGVSDSSYSHKQRGCQGQFVFTETGGVSGSVSGSGSGSGSSLLTGMCFARNGSRVPALFSPCRFNNVSSPSANMINNVSSPPANMINNV